MPRRDLEEVGRPHGGAEDELRRHRLRRGKREDHTLGNVFRALDFGLDVVTDHGRFTAVEGRRTFRLAKGSSVSVFATDPTTRMTSTGLEWPLDGVVFENLYCATLNRASAATVTLTATKRVYVYFPS